MVSSPLSILYDISNFTSLPPDDLNITAVNATFSEEDSKSDYMVLLDYIILPLAIIVLPVLLVVLIAFLIRKKRLDKLRHHLMPLYSFDPAEEGEDWEAELLEEGTDHQPREKNPKSSEPQLSFRSNL